MAVYVGWDNDEKTIVHFRFEKNWTWEQFFEAKAQAQDLMSSVPHKVAVILETVHDGAIPYNFLANVRRGFRTKHPQNVFVVIVAARPFVRTIISTFRALLPPMSTPIEIALSLDEARTLALDFLKTVGENALNQEGS